MSSFTSAITMGRMAAFIAIVLTVTYIIMAYQAQTAHKECEVLKGTSKDENYRRYWTYSIIILATIGTTFGFLNFVSADGPILVTMVALMCAIGATLYADTLQECKKPGSFLQALRTNPGILYSISFFIIALISFRMSQVAENMLNPVNAAVST